jgi:tetratricopeptide (TPR) repeat protein
MRLAVSIAAWSKDPDATLPPEHAQLPSALQALGFSVIHAHLAAGLSAALAGVEPTDTLLIHVSGVLAPEGSIELAGSEAMSLNVVSDALAAKPCARTLVFVEAAYRGEWDALRAVSEVEAVADALSSNAGPHTAVIAVHPVSADASKLSFTHRVIEATRDVVKADGTALIEDAYKRARETQLTGIAASGFAFLRGETPFAIASGLPASSAPASMAPASLVPAPAATEPALNVLDPAASARSLADALASAAPPAAHSSPSSPDWLEGSDVVEVSPREALDVSIAAATAAHDHRLAVKLSRERIVYLLTPEARVDELFEIGRTLVAKLHDLPEAVVTLEEARGIDPAREDILEALRRAYARLERWTEALEVTLALVRRTENAHERAGFRVAAALLACEHLADDDYAIELLTAALEDDPSEESALGELVRIRRSRGDLVDLEQELASLANRLVETGDAARAWDACQRLAALRRDDLGDAAGAVEALAIAKRLPLSELESRAVLAEQLLALGDDEGAVAELESIVASDPSHLRAHARLFSVHRREGNHDRAFLAALALEELGDADATAREMLEAYRADWGLRARSALDESAWDLLRAEGADEVIEAVFRASLRAAIAAQLEERGKRPVLDPTRRQPETSTASIIRCFHWAARALGTPCPALYVLDEVAGGIAAVAAPEPTTALGPEVLRGVSSKTLAFLAGRHITYFRPEYQVLVHFPTAESAAGLFFAAVEIVAPGTFVPPNLALRVAAAKHRLARHLRAGELAALSAAVGRLEARDAKVDLIAWIRGVELTAGRAGLLLAGDLQTALTQVRAEERGLSGMTVDARRADLLAFCASRTLADLRAKFTDTTRSSMLPPTSVRAPTTESAVVHRDDPSLRESGEMRAARLMA